MIITVSKELFPKALQVGDSVPFSERGMYIGNGVIKSITDGHYEVEVDNRVSENMDRYGK